MGVYVFNTGTLIHALSDDAKRNTSHDFGKNIIPDLVSSNRVCVYNFTERGTRLGSYWRDVGTVDAYYRANMELLLNPSFDPYDDADWPLYSFEGGRPYYTDTDRGAIGSVRDSVISREVSLARGSHVLHSVLSPGVQIGRFAKVHDSILLHDVHVGVGARIQRAILDENVRIADGVAIGYDVERDREYGLVTIPKHKIDILITDLRLPGMDGIELLKRAKTASPDIEVILITGFGTVEIAVEALKEGAYDFLTKPAKKAQLLRCVERAAEKQHLARENLVLRTRPFSEYVL
jgi:glucose-1-phosphate adenylyltransferase